jgi:molybdopterin converting factor small subunit
LQGPAGCAIRPPISPEKAVAKVVLASALSRWLPEGVAAANGESTLDIGGATVGEVLDGVFARHPNLRGYVVDEQGHVRHHVAIFVDGSALRRKDNLGQTLGENAEVHILQALSGG